MEMDCNLKTPGWCFRVFPLVLGKITRNWLLFVPPFEKINRFPSLGVLGVFLVRNKVFNLNFSKLFTPKRKNPLDRVPQTLWFDYAHGVKQR